MNTQRPKNIFWEMLRDNSPYAFYFLQWVDYQKEAKQWRLKLLHDIKLFDGRVFYEVYPNGDQWEGILDEQVQYIRISKKQFGVEYKDPRGE